MYMRPIYSTYDIDLGLRRLRRVPVPLRHRGGQELVLVRSTEYSGQGWLERDPIDRRTSPGNCILDQ